MLRKYSIFTYLSTAKQQVIAIFASSLLCLHSGLRAAAAAVCFADVVYHQMRSEKDTMKARKLKLMRQRGLCSFQHHPLPASRQTPNRSGVNLHRRPRAALPSIFCVVGQSHRINLPPLSNN